MSQNSTVTCLRSPRAPPPREWRVRAGRGSGRRRSPRRTAARPRPRRRTRGRPIAAGARRSAAQKRAPSALSLSHPGQRIDRSWSPSRRYSGCRRAVQRRRPVPARHGGGRVARGEVGMVTIVPPAHGVWLDLGTHTERILEPGGHELGGGEGFVWVDVELRPPRPWPRSPPPGSCPRASRPTRRRPGAVGSAYGPEHLPAEPDRGAPGRRRDRARPARDRGDPRRRRDAAPRPADPLRGPPRALPGRVPALRPHPRLPALRAGRAPHRRAPGGRARPRRPHRRAADGRGAAGLAAAPEPTAPTCSPRCS